MINNLIVIVFIGFSKKLKKLDAWAYTSRMNLDETFLFILIDFIVIILNMKKLQNYLMRP